MLAQTVGGAGDGAEPLRQPVLHSPGWDDDHLRCDRVRQRGGQQVTQRLDQAISPFRSM
jgi:hypothetical protein